ncbi:hypothetical protein [Paraburkholderia sp. J67]|uniref:hypothetical protein n=1 Tax=Paraburkholderia sp. J67 TaxID=2805435 RepID=UPI002ABE9DCD|nr:hypothetical protein [Paraburkholderia sp. J67]
MSVVPNATNAPNARNSNIGWISGERLDGLLLSLTVAIAGILFWIAPRPAMVDVPQHAAQVALFRDLIAGTSHWSDLVRINYFTPYLIGYGLALALSVAMPILTAMKLVMMLAFFGYVAAGFKLCDEFKADRRLRWLCVPGFFGFVYQWGFYTFLIATPLAFLFLIVAHRFARSSGISGGFLLCLAGVGLFFSHGLVFLFACAVGAAFIPCFRKTPGQIVAALAPYAVLGLLALTYFVALHHNDLLVPEAVGDEVNGAAWDWSDPYGWHRSFTFLGYTVATTAQDWYFSLGAVFLLVAPWLMGARLNRRDPSAFAMIAALVIIWFGVPAVALGTAALYHRFAIFLLPAYALIFREPTPDEKLASSRRPQWLDPASFVRTAVVLFCWAYLCVLGVREYQFAQESAPFETVLDAAEPDQRALSLVLEPGSSVIHNGYTYLHYPLWYQVEKGGFVDFNFAVFLPEIVRFRSDRLPAQMRQLILDRPEAFDWYAVQGRTYRYFFVHHTEPLPAGMFKNDECEVALVKGAGEWSLFERRACR